MSASEAVKRVREELNLDKKSFAQELGISKTAVTNYENGIRKPKRSIVFKIKELAEANGIKVTIEELMS